MMMMLKHYPLVCQKMMLWKRGGGGVKMSLKVMASYLYVPLWWRLQSSAVIERPATGNSVWCVYLKSFFPEVTFEPSTFQWTSISTEGGRCAALCVLRCRCLQYHVSRLQQPPELGAEIARKPAVWVHSVLQCCRVNHLQGENISLDWHTSTQTHIYSCYPLAGMLMWCLLQSKF